jgi:hypothetical protein
MSDNHPITVDAFKAEDACGVGDLFRAIYADAYPVPTFYDPALLTQVNASRHTVSIVARSNDGTVVGHLAAYRSVPNPRLYELGAMVVLPAYRCRLFGRRTLAVRLLDYVLGCLPSLCAVDGFFGESVCNHLTTQKMVDRRGFTTTALEVDLMPAEAYVTEQSAQGRVSTIVSMLPSAAPGSTVYLPPPYRDPLTWIYGALSLTRDLQPAGTPRRGATFADSTVYASAGVTRVRVQRIGDDIDDIIAQTFPTPGKPGDAVAQFWLPMVDPGVGRAVACLRERGCFFGGVLPCRDDGDALLMQWMAVPPAWDQIRVYGQRGLELLARVRSDAGIC